MVMTSPSMPVSSERLTSLRRPSVRRATWMTTLIAEAIWAACRTRRDVDAAHADHLLDARQSIARRVGVDRRHRAIVARVHRLQHVERFAGANLADDDAVGPHAQGILDQVALRDLALALDIRRPGLEAHDMLLLQLELGANPRS